MTGRALVTFRAAGERWAIDVDAVREFAPLGHLTRVPGAGPGVAGVTPWRGRTVPVLHVAPPLKGDAADADLPGRILVLRCPGTVALRVERPARVLRPGEWETGEEDGRRELRTAEGPVRLLDPETILTRATLPGADASTHGTRDGTP